MALKQITRYELIRLCPVRSLWLIWKNPETGRYFRVGQLDQLEDQRYVFSYEKQIRDVVGFGPLVEFPALNASYVSDALPAFFSNRVMSQDRENYGDYRRWLGLETDGWDTPMEVLARSGGARATDTFHLVEKPGQHAKVLSRFFISGIRHSPSPESAKSLVNGQELELRDDPKNPHNSLALLLDRSDGQAVGWVPDWLLDTVHAERVERKLRVFVERANMDAPSRLQVLCRMEYE